MPSDADFSAAPPTAQNDILTVAGKWPLFPRHYGDFASRRLRRRKCSLSESCTV